MGKEISIYIHIPFCESRCYYCDFYSTCGLDESMVSKYTDSVCKEILNNSDILSEYEIKTIYFGGGTPSYVDTSHIEKIMSVINLFNNKSVETTIELNPADSTIEKLSKYLELGFNRFSIGFQSANNDILKSIGRRHTVEDFEKAYSNMITLGIDNISVDLITGLPGDNIDEYKRTLEYVIRSWG